MTESRTPVGSGFITPQARREALEQVFFHDLLNLVEGLDGLACRLTGHPESVEAVAGQLRDLSCRLADEIQNQRILLGAEEGVLVADRRDLSPPEILDTVRGIFANHQVAERRSLEIRQGPPGTFSTDPVLLTRVLVNLVKNAFEATPEGGTVKLWQEWRDGRRGFLVENASAMAPAVAKRIFERSHDPAARRGRGLGTYSAKLLGEQYLGGEVGFSSPSGGPTRFFIWLPDRGSAPGAYGSKTETIFMGPEPDWTGAGHAEGAFAADRLLVIDDSGTVRRLLGNILDRQYRVLTASSGEEGLAMALEHAPDLILLDVMMPGMDGFSVCTRLKADSRTREIPVLFLTVLNGEGDEMRALEAGGIDFIPKPISHAVLCARVRNQLALKRTQDKLRNLSLLDGLTGIANRRRFDQYLELEWQRCTRSADPISVVMGDVDFFKAYNDGYGHGQGDECLRKVANIFSLALRRPADLAARYGGEEFVCILPETDAEGARIVAEQIMAGMARLGLPHAFSSAAEHVTVSVGVATALRPSPGQTARHLMEEVDQRLYQAKHLGRNRIVGL
jgi:diguanylate cyclase (GGDEF)-like protein